MGYAEAEKALATREAYASDWCDFAAWCALRGATALPAHQGIVAAYLSGLADSGRKASTIGRRAAAIGYHHKMARHEPPTSSKGVWAVLRCQIASNSDPLFASNINPPSLELIHVMHRTRARSAAPQALRGAKGAGGPCASRG